MSKTDEYEWSVLKPDIFAAIMDHFAGGEPLFTDPTAVASDTAILDTDTEVPPGVCLCVRVHKAPPRQSCWLEKRPLIFSAEGQ